MTTTEESTQASRLGLQSGQAICEIGYGDDVDQGLRKGIKAVTGKDLVDEDSDDVTGAIGAFDGVIMWFREEDGDLAESLTSASMHLDEGGTFWLLTPKAGKAGHVPPSDISEAATAAGLPPAASISAARDWTGTRLPVRR
ncbi:DUF3052 domain-containing protein [Streptomyces sp. NPDC050844]|uniref:DUF3052 domain-containing protein n=1 Tax=Streptomyces sp. NPDC050844 TaxID=3155790 RepID=UPI0033E9FC0E